MSERTEMKNKTGVMMAVGAFTACMIVAALLLMQQHQANEFCIYRNYDGVKMCGDAARQFCAQYGCG